MKRSRFTEEQIIGILRQSEAGIRVVDLYRQKASQMRPFTNGAANSVGDNVRYFSHIEKIEVARQVG